MEIIRRKICLESGRSRKQGLLPFYAFNDASNRNIIQVTSADTNGNFGGFVANFYYLEREFNHGGGILRAPIEHNPNETEAVLGEYHNYIDDNRKYNTIINGIEKGVIVKLINKGDEHIWVVDKDSNNLYNYSIIGDFKKFTRRSDGVYTVSMDYSIFSEDITHAILVKNYDDIKKYAKSEDLYAGGIFLKTNTIFDFCKWFDDLCGILTVDDSVTRGIYAGRKICLCDIQKEYEWMANNSGSTDCCTIKRWEERGGQNFLTFLSAHLNDYNNKIQAVNGSITKTIPPTIDVPILLTSDYHDLGVYNVYEEDNNCDIVEYTGSTFWETSGLTVESKLHMLRSRMFYYDDDGNILPGLFSKVGSNKYYHFSGGDWTKISEEDVADNVNDSEYSTFTVFSGIPSDYEGFAFVLFENGSGDGEYGQPMDIPYASGVTFNAKTTDSENIFTGDFINNIRYTDEHGIDVDKISASTITIDYVLGGLFSGYTKEDGDIAFSHWINETGIEYSESYNYKFGDVIYVNLDEKHDVPIYYNKIDFDSAKKEFKHVFINTTRLANTADIIGYQKNDWIVNGDVCNLPIYKVDYLVGSTNMPETSVNVSINRGNAAAFEKHLKMSECNSMDDLVNYSNNFFNL